MEIEPSRQSASDRTAILGAVTTYLGFFALVLLVVEFVVGAIALKGQGDAQVVALYGFLLFVFVITAVVAFFAYFSPDTLTSSTARQMREFGSQINGHWLQTLSPNTPSALSLVTIHSDPATGIVRMDGPAFELDGEPSAHWETKATCTDVSAGKMFYYWKGWFRSGPNDEWEGWGEITFDRSANPIQRGTGMFSDMNLTAKGAMDRKLTTWERCSEHDLSTLRGDDSAARAQLIRRKCGRPALAPHP